MSFIAQVLILILLAAFLLGIAYLEMRYIKTRGARGEAKIERDEAFNAITTIRSVADSLENQGFDTTEAEPIIFKAELAYRSGNYVHARTQADQARSLLVESHDQGPDPLENKKFPGISEDRHTAQEEIKATPKGLIEARFMIDMVEDLINDQNDAELISALDSAKRMHEAGDHEGAFAEACRVKNVLGDREAPIVEKIVYVCPNCDADVGADDVFCRRCGTPLD